MKVTSNNSIDRYCVLDANRLQKLKRENWFATGVIAAIIGAEGSILTLEHNRTPKNKDGALGPLAETAQVYEMNAVLTAESCSETLARGLKEELNLSRAVRLGTVALNSCFTFAWPVGKRFSFAVCPILICQDPDSLLDQFEPTEEVRAASFMSPEAVLHKANVRPGTHEWIRSVLAHPAYNAELQELGFFDILAGSGLRPAGVDIKFDDPRLRMPWNT